MLKIVAIIMAGIYCSVPLVADAGLALSFFWFPLMLLLFFPIILIEAVVVQRKLRCAEIWPVLRATVAANVVSTILGIPISAASFLLIVTLSGSRSNFARAIFEASIWPWGASSAGTRAWAIPLADLVFFVLLVPCFVVSVWSERKVMARMLTTTTEASTLEFPSILVSRPAKIAEPAPLRQAVWSANVLSYLVIFSVFCLAALHFRAQ